MSAAAAAGLAALAVWWALPPGSAGLYRLRAVATRRPGKPGRAARVAWGTVVAVGAVVAAALVGGPRGAALALALVQLLGAAWVLGARRRSRVWQARRRADVAHAGELIAGLLRVGRVPSAALVEAAEDADVLRVAAAEARAGGEVAAALRRESGVPGAEGLADLAAAWDVALRTGASLVEALDAASARLVADAEVARVVETELAGTRLAGRMMAILPLAGLGMGYALGGDPIGFLLGAPLGWVCLNVGVGLACAGLVWMDSIAEAAGGR